MFEISPYPGSSELQSLRRRMDDLWNRFAEGPLLPSFRGDGAFIPTVDIRETDKAIEVDAEIPGLKPEEIEVSLTGNVLTIKGEKKEEREEKKDNYHMVERRFGRFSRSFRLPVDVKNDKIDAKYKDGVMRLVLPRSEEEPTTKIKVKSS